MNSVEIKSIIKKESNIYRRFYKGFEYWIIRPHSALSFSENPACIHLCGYVVIDKSSKYYISNSYDDYSVECHGGLTFAGSIEELSIDFAIGFDCNHCDDAGYLGDELLFATRGIYRNVDYVDGDCKLIINQLTSMEGKEND